MTFAYSGNDTFVPCQDFPSELYCVPGGEVSAYENYQGKIAVQELHCLSCQVFQMTCRMNGKSRFRVRDREPFLLTFMALQQDQQLGLEGIGTVHLREGQYNMFYAPEFNFEITHEDSKEFIGLGLNYQLHALQEMTPYFPGLAGFLEKVQAGQPALLQPEHSWATGEIQDAVYRVLHCPVSIKSYPVYIDSLVKALLFHLLWQCFQQQPASKYSHYEIEGIYAARDMIRKNIRYHFTIPEIAQKVGMNEFKLKTGFREIFGYAIYEYLHSERMMEARRLLSDPEQTVIKAFKKKYNLTPGEFRKGM
jgi:AraC family transcriptional regulator, transcriptional activator of the genes for pyochelin and ferripyochelin receptors